MAVLDCREAVKSIKNEILNRGAILKEKGISPKLVILRVGERPEDISYERSILKNCTALDIAAEVLALPEDIGFDSFICKLNEVNNDSDIHGILIFRPLPASIPEDKVKHLINPDKDIDCMNPQNLVRIFEGDRGGFAPCTPAAVMEIIKYFKIDINGRNTAVIGRSMVVGKPLAMIASQGKCHKSPSAIQNKKY